MKDTEIGDESTISINLKAVTESHFIRGSSKRQVFWACALDLVSNGNADEYMSEHCNHVQMDEFWT